jgi:hypothetical protein
LARKGRIVTVSESDIVNLGEHIAVDFFCPRGWRTVTKWVREQRAGGFVVDVFLDYFYLPNMYWRHRYNIDWLTFKVPALLAAGARRIILPRTHAMVVMEGKVNYRGTLLEPSDHPLWAATEESGVEPLRGNHATHMDNLIEDGPFMVYDAQCIPSGTGQGLGSKKGNNEVVVAGRFDPQRKGRNTYQMWWAGGGYTWEPKRNISGLANIFLDRMHSTLGRKVKFTGAVGDGGGTWKLSVRHCDRGILFPASGHGMPMNIAHQTPGSHCALNSVANGIHIPAEKYFSLYLVNLGLEQVIHALRSDVGHLTKVPQCDGDLPAWLFSQSEGVFAVESREAHCFTWDCGRKLLLDSAPRFPHPLPATPENLYAMGGNRLTKAYRLQANLLARAKQYGNARTQRQKNMVCTRQSERETGERKREKKRVRRKERQRQNQTERNSETERERKERAKARGREGGRGRERERKRKREREREREREKGREWERVCESTLGVYVYDHDTNVRAYQRM